MRTDLSERPLRDNLKPLKYASSAAILFQYKQSANMLIRRTLYGKQYA